jgi:hypothetical protein
MRSVTRRRACRACSMGAHSVPGSRPSGSCSRWSMSRSRRWLSRRKMTPSQSRDHPVPGVRSRAPARDARPLSGERASNTRWRPAPSESAARAQASASLSALHYRSLLPLSITALFVRRFPIGWYAQWDRIADPSPRSLALSHGGRTCEKQPLMAPDGFVSPALPRTGGPGPTTLSAATTGPPSRSMPALQPKGGRVPVEAEGANSRSRPVIWLLVHTHRALTSAAHSGQRLHLRDRDGPTAHCQQPPKSSGPAGWQK